MTRLLTIAEVASRLGLGLTTVYRLAASKSLPVLSVGPSKGLRVAESDLDRWLAGRYLISEPTTPGAGRRVIPKVLDY